MVLTKKEEELLAAGKIMSHAQTCPVMIVDGGQLRQCGLPTPDYEDQCQHFIKESVVYTNVTCEVLGCAKLVDGRVVGSGPYLTKKWYDLHLREDHGLTTLAAITYCGLCHVYMDAGPEAEVHFCAHLPELHARVQSEGLGCMQGFLICPFCFADPGLPMQERCEAFAENKWMTHVQKHLDKAPEAHPCPLSFFAICNDANWKSKTELREHIIGHKARR